MCPPAARTPRIVLCTLNARYIHASLGLRYLLANLGGLRGYASLREFTVSQDLSWIAQELLVDLGDPDAGTLQILGLGVYIWNVQKTTELVRQLRALRPGLVVVLGGPEVSHESDAQDIVALADFVITGWGDVSFAQLCQDLVAGVPPAMKILAGVQPPLAQIALPYGEYSAQDLAHRLLYVEASRGCPFMCEFCLSALDKTAWALDTGRLLEALHGLYARGARQFKFVDRTFNLKTEVALRILQFFLERQDGPLFVHFELVPDRLPEPLRSAIAQFKPGVLQLEVGVQTFNAQVQQLISRRQDNQRTQANLQWLVQHTHAHLHADLIFGLPGEDLESFAAGFDRLYQLRPHEIQLGLLKRLRGTPIGRHSAAHALVFDACPPYTVQRTALLDAETVQRVARMARYWDLVVNSGRYRNSLALLLPAFCTGVFHGFLAFSDWLWLRGGKTHGLTPEWLVDALHTFLVEHAGIPAQGVQAALVADYRAMGAQGRPQALLGLLKGSGRSGTQTVSTLAQRQQRHAQLR